MLSGFAQAAWGKRDEVTLYRFQRTQLRLLPQAPPCLPFLSPVCRAENTPTMSPRSTPSMSPMSSTGWRPTVVPVPWRPLTWAPPAPLVLLATTLTESQELATRVLQIRS